MKDPVILKSSLFGGFKKAGVLSYIDQLDSESQKLKAELDEKIAQLEQQVASLENRSLPKRKSRNSSSGWRIAVRKTRSSCP